MHEETKDAININGENRDDYDYLNNGIDEYVNSDVPSKMAVGR